MDDEAGSTGAAATAEQRNILRHALGLNYRQREYRNHFVTGPGASDYDHCEALVAAGMMLKCAPSNLTGGDFLYIVTDAGKAAARAR